MTGSEDDPPPGYYDEDFPPDYSEVDFSKPPYYLDAVCLPKRTALWPVGAPADSSGGVDWRPHCAPASSSSGFIQFGSVEWPKGALSPSMGEADGRPRCATSDLREARDVGVAWPFGAPSPRSVVDHQHHHSTSEEKFDSSAWIARAVEGNFPEFWPPNAPLPLVLDLAACTHYSVRKEIVNDVKNRFRVSPQIDVFGTP